MYTIRTYLMNIGFVITASFGSVTAGNRLLKQLIPTTAPLAQQHETGGSTR